MPCRRSAAEERARRELAAAAEAIESRAKTVIKIEGRGSRRRDRRVTHGETVGRRMPLVRAPQEPIDAAPSPDEALIAREESDLIDLLQLSQALTGLVAEQQPLQRRAIAQRHVETWKRCRVEGVPVPPATRKWLHDNRAEFDAVFDELDDVYRDVKAR